MTVVAGDPLLSCAGLRREAGERVIVDVDRFELARGRTYLLSGPNGAGKTTLLRVLAGLEQAQYEKLQFDKRDVRLEKYPQWLRRKIAFVHHHPLLFSTSIVSNIAYGLRALGLGSSETARRAEAAVAWAGIEPLLDRSPQALSAGEKQRVALARAHALDPALYLLDEPTANLDGSGRDLVLRLIGAIGEEGRTLLIACHDRELLNLAGVSHLHMADGRVELNS
ncbi:MAG: ABC transporter ATP-binding protein [Burkholderiales bacterium]|jgi:tungstate transport system ATP-binding protein